MRLLFNLFTFLLLFTISTATQAQMFEDFEEGNKTFYAPASVSLETGSWFFDDALIGTLPQDKKNGYRSARIQNGFIRMDFCYPQGISELSVYAANFSSDTGGALQVRYSTDQGETWSNLGDLITLTGELTEYTIQESIQGNVRLKFEKASGNRINVDDVLISDYIEFTEEPAILVRLNNIPYANGSIYDFGVTSGSATASLQIRNTGNQDLVISEHDITGTAFTVDGNLNVTLAYLETASFELSFASDVPGIYEEALTIESNDPENPVFVLNLTAEVIDITNPMPIAEARNLPLGTTVTVAGWVTVADQFAGPVYFQDDTGGMAWYSAELMQQDYLVGAVIGDSLQITGELARHNSLLQIVNETVFEVFPEANQIIEPENITLGQLNTGNYEGSLISVQNLNFLDQGLFSGNAEYEVYDHNSAGQVYIVNNTNIPGTNIPNSTVSVTGVAGRFFSTHRLLPRFTNDIEFQGGPIIISTPPFESAATGHSITFEWETVHPGHSEIRYGQTPDLEMGSVINEAHQDSHSITIDGLEPATIYKVQLRSAFDADTSATSVYITTTRSPSGSTGDISVYFNKDVAHELTTFQEAEENVPFDQKLITQINQAQETAEFAFYSISGTVGEAIANAIIAANNRGVVVRVIASGHTGTTNPIITQLQNAGVKATQSLGNEQMHNKFAIFDAHHQDPSVSTVVTSSWNATDQGTNNQFQNMVIIQDVALARAYLREFNQMWGGESGNFNASNAKFSSNKSIENPSIFWIGPDETRVELYFSPQGNTEAQIIRKLNSAQSTIDFALNLITRNTLSGTMHNKFNEGVTVRGVLGDIGGQASEWEYLSSWADVHHLPQGEFGLLHHKYAIIDGEQGGSNAKVITGSHNWSANANFRNDENTVIIYNSRVANEYFQEFGARYWQAGGEDEFDVSTSIPDFDHTDTKPGINIHNFPNPFNNQTNIRFELPSEEIITLSIYDITGRRILTPLAQERLPAGNHVISIDTSMLRGGFYISRIQLQSGRTESLKMLKVLD